MPSAVSTALGRVLRNFARQRTAEAASQANHRTLAVAAMRRPAPGVGATAQSWPATAQGFAPLNFAPPDHDGLPAEVFPKPYTTLEELDPTGNETETMRELYVEFYRSNAEVHSAIVGKVAAIARLDCTILPADEDNPRDKEVAEFCQWCLENGGGTDAIIQELVTPALLWGWSCGEITLDRQPKHLPVKWRDRPRWTLEHVRQIDPRRLKLQLDVYRNIKGIVSFVRGAERALPNRYVLFTHNRFLHNPYGQSDLRPAFRSAKMIDDAYKLWYVLLKNYGGPVIIGKAGPGTQANRAYLDRFDRALRDCRASGFIRCSDADAIDVLNLAVAASMDAFERKVEAHKKAILSAVRGAYLPFMEGNQGDSRGDTSVNKMASNDIEELLARNVARAINYQLLPRLVIPNYGADCPLPKVMLGGKVQADITNALDNADRIMANGQPVSKRWYYRTANVLPPADPQDIMLKPAPQPMGGMPGDPGGGNPLDDLLGGPDAGGPDDGTPPAIQPPEPPPAPGGPNPRIQPPTPPAPPDTFAAGGDGVTLPTAALRTDPDRFQFRRNADDGDGTVRELPEATFDPDQCPPLGVWVDPADGHTYVVDGHHRLAWAKRDGAARVPVYFLTAETAEQAKAAGEAVNRRQDAVRTSFAATARPADLFAHDGQGNYPGDLHERLGIDADTFASRSHLVRKKITTVRGVQTWVWVNPNKGKHAGAADNPKPRSADSDPVNEAHTAVSTAVNAPEKVQEHHLEALAGHLDTLPRDRVRDLARQMGEKLGGTKVQLAQRLVESIRRQGAARQAVAAAVDAPETLKPEHLAELAGHLEHLPAAEVAGLVQTLTRKLGAAKAELAQQTADQAKAAPPPTPEPAPPPAPATPPPAAVPAGVQNVHPSTLKVDPARFQFKLNTANPAGVTDELKQVKTWNPDFAGVIAVWRDPADGQTYVVNGHHRHELASRLGVTDLAVRHIDAPDAQTARGKGALINIAEGRGTAVDAAKFMRDAGVTKEDFAKYGVTLKDGALADQATALAGLSDKAFKSVTAGDLEPAKAVAVAKHLGDHARQDKLFGLLQKRLDEGKDISNRAVEEMGRAMAAAPTVTKTENTLWGPEEHTEDTFVQRAELTAHVRGELARDLTDFGALASQRRADKTAGAGNVLAVEKNRELAADAAAAKNLFDTLANRKGPISDALNDGAAKLATAKTERERRQVRADTAEAVRKAVADTLGKKPSSPLDDVAGNDMLPVELPRVAAARPEEPAMTSPTAPAAPRFTPGPAAAGRRMASGKPVEAATPEEVAATSKEAIDTHRVAAGFDPSGKVTGDDYLKPGGRIGHGTILLPHDRVKKPVVHAVVRVAGRPEVVEAKADGLPDLKRAAERLQRVGLDPMEHLPAAVAHTFGSNPGWTRTLDDRVREYLAAGTLEGSVPTAGKRLPGEVRPGEWTTSESTGVWASNADSPDGGRVLSGPASHGVGDDHPDGRVVAVERQAGGKVVYTLRKRTPKEEERHAKAKELDDLESLFRTHGAVRNERLDYLSPDQIATRQARLTQLRAELGGKREALAGNQ